MSGATLEPGEALMGLCCTFGGGPELVTWRPRPLHTKQLMRAKGEPAAAIDALVPSCPYCHEPVGKVTLADLEQAMVVAAHASGQPIEKIREIYGWSRQLSRCLPHDPVAIARAYAADAKRQTRRVKRRPR